MIYNLQEVGFFFLYKVGPHISYKMELFHPYYGWSYNWAIGVITLLGFRTPFTTGDGTHLVKKKVQKIGEMRVWGNPWSFAGVIKWDPFWSGSKNVNIW